ncbi:hypothetical protein TVAG_225700 [Trichomonas vaginalis G3]|uniref:Uncharacterized protein n=1 Tax=Trichomonas vaginalis (strain ATCC PRA-98 / G3) TaxID=412133 RepID=A2DNU9_TRIV3|nr:hypothetical protein TVAGG3_0289200 [Trichomonas vaginalis G3]EAY17944.1 hypothetical protein TVAG_225700 [Trichomonas vaginalis G3]KAI5527126.1 hypothetical protein TVAGG3_0289200 [Trichomonas vaginalis G3]|eukprot:XP_001578930.1 hypothetical protein [Trichomonas vaginalis G3]
MLFVVTALFIILAAQSFYKMYFPKKSLYLTYQGENNSQTVNLSVIYHAFSTLSLIREQISCLIALLEENFPEDFKFQIIALHAPVSMFTKKQMKTLFPQDNRIVFIESKNGEFEHFVLGCAKSSGSIIVDSRYIAQMIDVIKTSGTDFIEFQERIVDSLVYDPDPVRFINPIALSKQTANQLLTNLPSYPYGFGYTLYNLAKKNNIQATIHKSKYEYHVDSFTEILFTELYIFFLKRFYPMIDPRRSSMLL